MDMSDFLGQVEERSHVVHKSTDLVENHLQGAGQVVRLLSVIACFAMDAAASCWQNQLKGL